MHVNMFGLQEVEVVYMIYKKRVTTKEERDDEGIQQLTENYEFTHLMLYEYLNTEEKSIKRTLKYPVEKLRSSSCHW